MASYREKAAALYTKVTGEDREYSPWNWTAYNGDNVILVLTKSTGRIRIVGGKLIQDGGFNKYAPTIPDNTHLIIYTYPNNSTAVMNLLDDSVYDNTLSVIATNHVPDTLMPGGDGPYDGHKPVITKTLRKPLLDKLNSGKMAETWVGSWLSNYDADMFILTGMNLNGHPGDIDFLITTQDGHVAAVDVKGRGSKTYKEPFRMCPGRDSGVTTGMTVADATGESKPFSREQADLYDILDGDTGICIPVVTVPVLVDYDGTEPVNVREALVTESTEVFDGRVYGVSGLTGLIDLIDRIGVTADIESHVWALPWNFSEMG